MTPATTKRRLAAILNADVAGYSPLMAADEEATLASLKAHRAEMIDAKIAEHQGRIFKTTGDGVLAEFASVVDAVRCAAEAQEAMRGRNAGVPEAKGIVFRIGINVGDVIVDGDDLYGDGVNLAARVQECAEPGGIAISATVHDQLEGKTTIPFADAGSQALKNIARPVRIWRWAPDGQAPRPVSGPPPALPGKPSIAVLPFDNMSKDAEQDYFADGVTEEIITALSRVHWFFVIARNSTFAYKGRSPDVREVARDLGVRYVLEGSVRRAGNRVRIAAQLIQGATGKHMWAKRYDRELEDIFALQDEITETIVGEIEPEMSKAERQRAREEDWQSGCLGCLPARTVAPLPLHQGGHLRGPAAVPASGGSGSRPRPRPRRLGGGRLLCGGLRPCRFDGGVSRARSALGAPRRRTGRRRRRGALHAR